MANDRIEDIEILRALAVILILVEHRHRLFPWTMGDDPLQVATAFWGGVDVFLAISGFVVTRQLQRMHRVLGPDGFLAYAIPFWVRRAYRIVPSAVLWATIVLAASVAFNRSGVFGDPLGNFFDWVAATLQVSNVHWIHCVARQGTCGVSIDYWSISLAAQFYLVFPVLLFVLVRLDRRALPLALVLVVLAQVFVHRPVLSALWFLRTDAIALGALVALAAPTVAAEVKTPRFLWSAAGSLGFVMLMLLFISVLGSGRIASIGTGVIAVLSALLVLVASRDEGLIWPAGFGRRVLAWLGSRAYAIYLAHMAVFVGVREGFHRLYPGEPVEAHAAAVGAAAVVLLLVLSELSYRLVETPLRRRGVRFAGQMTAERLAHRPNRIVSR